ncbi:MAG: cobalt ECF transporter T component CbiQ [Candidatus Jettenia sp.]|uniref:Cobalt ABC transporter permease component n=1 Tax=Candidatus Jettenia caeni TaxID=247490 RepID=I3INN8_9BACT|nr:cobalt ECF transporter T component CbiQ [Candidatus Jettenia sp. AMX1]MBC6928438.1 cobalt ECF transporter T component CbiQ [Candidatus Jettenia sp.]WKZ15792.1 MAG: cobalt ECF transporter T component CbiQ [Candidatus Jettenia caeni]MCE7879633.1 cobalt ECF transporter T component CbiQ [Candidatus Jettenia sp. AMX1]MCQ3926501.1 cobalt ECF transporter T component CbiQ [Candidatus Jettenia sp.]MDL1938172.1 cobalt ECF transporter T component CbiQ [Candidatus Jettenia sp. AMX1]
MGFLHHTFSEVYARKNNWLTRVDIRVKLLYIISLLSINVLAKNISVPLFFLFTSFVLVLSVKVPFPVILRNLLLPMLLAIFILLMKGLHEGERVWMSFSFIGYKVALKEEGLWSGIHICSKVLGGVSLVMLLSFTTTIRHLCTGLKWFRIPDTVIELLSFMYRYIFLFLDEVATIWIAQKSRLGHASWKKTIQSFGILGGMLIIRAFERSERTYEAMQVRGYKGDGILMVNLSPWRKREYLFTTGILFLAPFLVYAGTIPVW